MKKLTYILGAALVCLCMMLAGCGSQGQESDDTNLNSTPDVTANHYSLEMVEAGNYNGYAVLTAYDEDDNVLWTFESDEYTLTELSEPTDMHICNGVYYICAGTTIYGIDADDGEELWRNDEFGGHVAGYAFDDDGILYACGFYGPDLGLISSDGSTVKIISKVSSTDEAEPEWYRPYSVKLQDGDVILTFETGQTVRVDLETGIGSEVFSEESEYEYSDDEFREFALSYYEDMNGERPPCADVIHNGDGTVTIHLYEDMSTHVATWDWYTIDEHTLVGTDMMDNSIDIRP